MVVINLFGSPGTGKSTTAAKVFAALKDMGVPTELVTEFAKDLTWEQNKVALNNQIYVFANQHYRLARLEGRVHVAVVDSPLLISNLYGGDEHLHKLVLNEFNKFHNINFFLKRTKPYAPYGRTQTELESNTIADKMEQYLVDSGVVYQKTTGDDAGVKHILKTFGLYNNYD
jgi:hypothetical protein